MAYQRGRSWSKVAGSIRSQQRSTAIASWPMSAGASSSWRIVRISDWSGSSSSALYASPTIPSFVRIRVMIVHRLRIR
jgi:hypothetical protein